MTSLKPVTGLLILQPTNYCNIDCKYCYLPNRNSKGRMSLDTIEATIRNLRQSGLIHGQLTVVWHAGEPLVLPVEYYEAAFSAVSKGSDTLTRISQALQTNGLLISDRFCELFCRHEIQVGISIDGPAFLHDDKRVTRTNKGTFASAMRGLKKLQEHGVAYNVLTVLSDISLDYAAELYEFYLKNSIHTIGFNIDEIDGVNQTSSMHGIYSESRYVQFFREFYRLVQRDRILTVREFRSVEGVISEGGVIMENHLVTPLAIVSVDIDGNYSTFSPELLGITCDLYGSFVLGNVHHDPIDSVWQNAAFARMLDDVRCGVDLCEMSCAYFAQCRGGSPSNKLAEHGSFRASETHHCRFTKQLLFEAIMTELEDMIAACARG
jgi:uncharacterized protein